VDTGTDTKPAFQHATLGDGGPRILTKQQHDPVAFYQADRDEKICQLIGLALYVAEGHSPGLTVGSLADQRNFARVRRMAVANIGGDVVARAGMFLRNEA
jgi:hypothetical protein